MNDIRHSEDFRCIGSFYAKSQDGKVHTIEMWCHFDAVHDRERSRVIPAQIALTTIEGHGIDRLAQGQYRLRDNPEVSLSSDDPHAP